MKDQKLISRRDATKKYSRSETTMWRDERDEIIPPAIRINGRKFWIESELDAAYLSHREEKTSRKIDQDTDLEKLKLLELLEIEPTTDLERELMRRLAIVPKLADNTKRYMKLFEEFRCHPFIKEGIELAQRKYEQQARQRARRQV